TCRIRRKKCDEERVNDECRTCRRLEIECLGWGSRRPDWMKDKDALQRKKAEIKERLTRAGKIRGQPRHSPSPLETGEGSLPARRQRRRHTQQTPTVMSHRPTDPNETSHFRQLPTASYSDPTVSRLENAHDHPNPAESFFSSLPCQGFGAESGYAMPSVYDQNIRRMQGSEYGITLREPSPNAVPQEMGMDTPGSGRLETYTFYFFSHVRDCFFSAQDAELASMTSEAIVQEPQGAVVHAVTSVAAIHYSHTRMVTGMIGLDDKANYAKWCHEQSHFLIASSRQQNGEYTEWDALAALHLITFAQISGLHKDWKTALDVAAGWLEQTRLSRNEDPVKAYLLMGATARFLVRCILIAESLASLTLLRPNRFAELFRVLARDVRAEMQGAGLNGVPYAVALSITDVTAFARWKAIELRDQHLSYRTLVQKAEALERQIIQNRAVIGEFVDDRTRLYANVFNEGALLYLHTIVNGHHPGVPEIAESVQNIVNLLQQTPRGPADRLLLFPVCIAACMTDNWENRQFLRIRLGDENIFRDAIHARLLMEKVWQHRDTKASHVDWQLVMAKEGPAVLLL
ncbi:hypothetical protein FISHEDRAFT_51905, partial [Fistulina hepatica ATCC 64428]